MHQDVAKARMSALRRFHESASDKATLIYTCARSTWDGTKAPFDVYQRQLILIIDLVHEFCFAARRAIERADNLKPGLIKLTNKWPLHKPGETASLDDELAEKVSYSEGSLWWILGRIIHSRESGVRYRTVERVITSLRTGQHRSILQPVAFGFASERDAEAVSHHVGLEQLAGAYLNSLSHRIEEIIESQY